MCYQLGKDWPLLYIPDGACCVDAGSSNKILPLWVPVKRCQWGWEFAFLKFSNLISLIPYIFKIFSQRAFIIISDMPYFQSFPRSSKDIVVIVVWIGHPHQLCRWKFVVKFDDFLELIVSWVLFDYLNLERIIPIMLKGLYVIIDVFKKAANGNSVIMLLLIGETQRINKPLCLIIYHLLLLFFLYLNLPPFLLNLLPDILWHNRSLLILLLVGLIRMLMQFLLSWGLNMILIALSFKFNILLACFLLICWLIRCLRVLKVRCNLSLSLILLIFAVSRL